MPSRSPSAGRFAHESVAFDPRGGSLYLSEDNFGFPSGFYRYTPQTSPMETGRLANDGRLQMLKVKGVDEAHLEASQAKGARYHVEWVDIDDPAPSFPYTAGPARPDDEQRRARCTSATRDATRAPRTSPGSRGRSTTTASSTSPRPRAVARR